MAKEPALTLFAVWINHGEKWYRTEAVSEKCAIRNVVYREFLEPNCPKKEEFKENGDTRTRLVISREINEVAKLLRNGARCYAGTIKEARQHLASLSPLKLKEAA